MQQSLAVHEAARLVAGATEHHGVRVVVDTLEGWDAAGLRSIVSAMTTHDRIAVALFTAALPIAVAIARSPNVTLDASGVLRMLTERFGGRGGGKADLAQGAGLIGTLTAIIDAAKDALIAGAHKSA